MPIVRAPLSRSATREQRGPVNVFWTGRRLRPPLDDASAGSDAATIEWRRAGTKTGGRAPSLSGHAVLARAGYPRARRVSAAVEGERSSAAHVRDVHARPHALWPGVSTASLAQSHRRRANWRHNALSSGRFDRSTHPRMDVARRRKAGQASGSQSLADLLCRQVVPCAS